MKQNIEMIHILMADDDEDDRSLTQDAFEECKLANNLHFVEDGEELLDYLQHNGKYKDPKTAPRPGIILLDLNMPKMNGWEALKAIKEDKDLNNIPVIVLTTSKSDKDILGTYDLGGNSYITKPVDFSQLVEVVKALKKYWFEIVKLPKVK